MAYEYKYRAHAEALHAALVDDAFYIMLEKSVDNGSQKEGLLRYLDYSIVESELYGRCLLSNKADYGASIWSLPLDDTRQQQKDQEKQQFLIEYMGENSLKIYKDIVENMSADTDPVVSADGWYLSILGLAPAFHGKGLGGGLLMPILEQADSAGVSTYLETFNPKNKSFYSRLGYVDAACIDEPVTQSRYWVMVRPAQ